VRAKFAELAAEIAHSTGRKLSPEQVAEGFIDVAVGAMANAVKKISVARGYDVTRYTLQCYGGAGGQHACRVADALGIDTVFVHPLAGVLSAYGMGLADQIVILEAAIEQPFNDALAVAGERLDTLAGDAERELRRQTADSGGESLRVQKRVHLRYEGTDSALVVPFGSADEILSAFEAVYLQRFAFLMPDHPLVVEAVSVEAVAEGSAPTESSVPTDPAGLVGSSSTPRTVPMFSGGHWWDARLVPRDEARSAEVIDGPAIITEENATTIVEPGWQAQVTDLDHLLLERVLPREGRRGIGTDVDPVMLEVFNNLFMSIAEQMGVQLESTASSVNIKERLDFSCAVFDGAGDLVANAPHMPVHLGSMSESIRTVISRNESRTQPGDVFVMNDPYHGGTHLPDVTVVTPVFDAEGRSVLFYVGSRGHHADIGGVTPGSMPPFSTRIEEEGVQIDNVTLVAAGRFREAQMLALLTGGAHPARDPGQNLSDLRAQVAANETGVRELHKMIDQFGLPVVQAYMQHVQDNGEESVRKVISKLSDGAFTLPLDNGARIAVEIRVDTHARSAVIDFTGSSPQLANNFNAPTAVCTAAVLYVFRTLVDDDIPLNAGCLRPLQIVIPDGSMLNPRPPASVVAGNVETSTCITNALYGALGSLASAQCTMNNFTFGDEHYQYYETIAGGSGAGPDFDGTAVVQTHMTNSRLTDPEVLETRFPVRIDSFEIRDGSGGAGRHRGGDGGVRRVRFLENMTASILSNGRHSGAFGLAGGSAGMPGINRVERADGTVEVLDHIASVVMHPGDVFVIETPGGGGFGA
ncbi:MAG: hypothetical protein QOF28_436, partial [Actinomycetota bacterium]|nr:hypothetical protein [Actinomycetota bacterium]